MMRPIIALVAIAAAPLLVAEAASAAPAGGGAGARPGPNIVVEGDRVICRRAVRTSSRMRTGRICRTPAEWRANGVAFSSSRGDIEDAQNALDMFAERVSTNDLGGELDRDKMDTPLGPR